MQNDGTPRDSNKRNLLFKSRTRVCKSCGKEFVAPGRLSDYLYKVNGKYACCYSCYLKLKNSE